MPKLYAKCGFNRNTSRAVLAAPIELGGGGFTPLYVTAGTGYVTHFLKNWRTPTEDIGKQLRIVYAWGEVQLERWGDIEIYNWDGQTLLLVPSV
jgi:hypothetical protein